MIKFKALKLVAITTILTSSISVSILANATPSDLVNQCYTDITMPDGVFNMAAASYADTLTSCVENNICSQSAFNGIANCGTILGTRNFVSNFQAFNQTLNPNEFKPSFGNFNSFPSQEASSATAAPNNGDLATKNNNATSNPYLSPAAPSSTNNTSNTNSNSSGEIHWF